MTSNLSLTCSALRLHLAALSECFTLNYVTIVSSAFSFTATTASSVDPLCIVLTLLWQLGLKVSHLHRPTQTALHRVRLTALSCSSTFYTHASYGKDFGLRRSWAPHPLHKPLEGSLALR